MVRPVTGYELKRLLAGVVLLSTLATCAQGGEPPPVVLLITVDTLRSDRVGAYGNKRRLTPSLDRLASRSQLFETVYAPASFTLPGISAILTGRYPEQNVVFANNSILPRGAITLAMLLKVRGYRTGAVVSNFVLRAGTGLERGFDTYDARFPQRELNRKLPERTATRTTDDALRVLDHLTVEGEKRVFLWVHYQDPHGPYTPPEELRERILEGKGESNDSSRVLPIGNNNRGLGSIPAYQRMGDKVAADYYEAGYDAEVRYADGEIGRFLDGVEKRNLYRRALVIFAADHGESLGENNYWFAHGEYLTDPLVRVPLLIRVPGKPPRRRADVAALIDILPTILPLFRIERPSGLPGRDLFLDGAELQASTPYMATLRASTVPRFGLVSGGFKYLVTVRDGQRQEQLFRLGDEGKDLKDTHAQQLENLRRRLRMMRKQFQPTEPERVRTRSQGDRSKLRALGYIHDD